ncbi:uncharacterized protein [Parasteatoda tepidariorum]|uniref:uncharacterized protein n=1 Tax=Parasteatoda tepidariorum TaxID=114398 RepID=UPI00077FE182|nr:uncharacterized protein LOC107452251 [Parasteatoda tepidariorum]
MYSRCNHAASFLFIFFSNFPFLDAQNSTLSYFITEDIGETLIATTEIDLTKWTTVKITKRPLTKFKIKKRTSRKIIGEKCSSFRDCPLTALCVNGICSCPYDYYNYVPQSDPELSVCRKKLKFGFLCTLTEDCVGYDSNSACSDGVCKCINGTHYIGSRNLLSYNKRCYKILDREGDVCDIDEQCSRLADNHHKCRCIGRCDCTSTNSYGGCSICHENIKRTFFGGAAFIAILFTTRVFSRVRKRTSSQQQQNMSLSGSRERCYRLNTSRTVPLPSVSYSRSNLRSNRHIASSLPDVFLIESHNLIGLHSSNTTDFYPQTSPSNTDRSTERSEDAPPSYEDIIGRDHLVWSEPPPSYQEVASKSP